VGNKIELVVGYVGDSVGATAGATAIVEQFNSDKNGFSLVNQQAQTGATIANVLSIVGVMGGVVPFLNVATNTLAGTITFLKITAEYKDTGEFGVGDVISLIGNVAGGVAAFTLLAGFGPVSLGFTVVAVAASTAGLVNSDTARVIHDTLVAPLSKKYFESAPAEGYPDHWVSPDLQVVPRPVITEDHGGMVAAIRWDSTAGSVSMGSVRLFPPAGSPSGGGESSWGIGAGGISGGGGGVPGEHSDIEISIEMINGDPLKGHPPVSDPTDPPQDGYGCCTGSQDAYH